MYFGIEECYIIANHHEENLRGELGDYLINVELAQVSDYQRVDNKRRKKVYK